MPFVFDISTIPFVTNPLVYGSYLTRIFSYTLKFQYMHLYHTKSTRYIKKVLTVMAMGRAGGMTMVMRSRESSAILRIETPRMYCTKLTPSTTKFSLIIHVLL